MVLYEDYVDSKTVRNTLKEEFPKAADAALTSNSWERAKKMLSDMERDKHEKLKNYPVASIKEADNLIQKSLDDSKSSKLCGIEFSNPEFSGLLMQELKTILNDVLEKGE